MNNSHALVFALCNVLMDSLCLSEGEMRTSGKEYADHRHDQEEKEGGKLGHHDIAGLVEMERKGGGGG